MDAAIREFVEETGCDLSNIDTADDFALTLPDAVVFFPGEGDCCLYALYVKCKNLEELADEINNLLSSNDRADAIDGELDFVRTERREAALDCFNNVIPVNDQACATESQKDRGWFRAILANCPA